MNTSDIWLGERLDELAEDIGRLRWRTRNTDLAWVVDRIADRVWWLLANGTPTAGDLVRSGHTLEDALEATEKETLRINRRLGA